ncbi:MAG: hypothetical protein IT287_04190 [Bdellovibrionaceae bacterium]|nr:hypothetical protein [Pseudobdellovibrionaceae bacterium]
MKRHLGKSGFSIIEIVVASVVLAIIVGSAMTFMSNTETKDTFRGKIQSNNACLAEANKILSNIKEKGQSRYRLNYPDARIKTGNYVFGAGVNDSTGKDSAEPGITHAHRWDPALPIYEVAPDANVLSPSYLIMGYMMALQGMYNSSSGTFCASPGAASYGDNSIITDPTSGLLDTIGGNAMADATSRLRIQIFNVETGAISCPGSVNIRPVGAKEATLTTRRQRPPGLTAANHPLSASEEVFDPNTAQTYNLGFLVTATVRYTDRKGSIRSCSVQEKFQYNAQPENSLTLEFEDLEGTLAATDDTNVPEGINTTVRSSNQDNPADYSESNLAVPNAIYNSCSGTNTRNISFRMTRTRPGSIHMCRNLSALRAATAGTDYRTGGTPLHTYNGFALEMGRPLRTTFYSTELMQRDAGNGATDTNLYFASKDEAGSDPAGDLFVAGLYYPAGTYYCIGNAGCGGSADGTSTAEIIDRAMPRFPRGSAAPGGTLNTHFFNSAGGYRYYLPSDHNADTDTAANWQPCEQVANVCGNAGSDVTGVFEYGDDATGRRDAYRVSIPNLPGGCEVHIQIAEVDAGYNVKATEFREYIQEKVPGNKLCRNETLGNARFLLMDPMGAGTWFFACTGVSTTLSNQAAAAPSCQSSPTTDCCIDYPFYPEYKAFHDP